MNEITGSEDFYSRINKICNFYLHSPGSGLLFCSASDYRLIISVNQIITGRLALQDFRVGSVKIDPDEIQGFYNTVKQAAAKYAGLIIYNLDDVILKAGDIFFSKVNLLREDLIDLKRPLLFWLSEKNISRLANRAADFFLRRDRGVVYFPELVQPEKKVENVFAYPLEAEVADSYESVLLKIEILKRQLKEAKGKKYQQERIAGEIVVPLIREYLKVFMYPEAEQVYAKYKLIIKKMDNTEIADVIASLYYKIGRWDESLQLYLNSIKQKEKKEDKSGIAITYHQIGMIHQDKGEYDQAIAYYNKSLKINEALVNKNGIANSFGQLCLLNQKLGNHQQALEYILRAYHIFRELGSPNIRLASRNILSLKEHFTEAQFNQHLLQSGINPAELTATETQ